MADRTRQTAPAWVRVDTKASAPRDPADGAGLSWLYRHSEVLASGMGDDGRMAVTVRADLDQAARVKAKFGM